MIDLVQDDPSFEVRRLDAADPAVQIQVADRDARWARHGRSAFDWFLGHNHLRLPLYDASTGGCRDGLHAERINENQGAESTLSFLLALLELRSADATSSPGATAE